MTNKEVRLSSLKFKLKNMKDERKKYVVWKLNPEQRDFVQTLGYQVTPWIYEVQTAIIENRAGLQTQKSLGILWELHFARKRGQKKMYKHLKANEVKILEQYNVSFVPLKYKIILQ